MIQKSKLLHYKIEVDTALLNCEYVVHNIFTILQIKSKYIVYSLMLWVYRREWIGNDRDRKNPFELFLKDYNKRMNRNFTDKSITAVIILDDTERGCLKNDDQNASKFLHSAPTSDIR